MGCIGKNFQYKKIKNFLTKDEINLLSKYCVNRHKQNRTSFDKNINSKTNDTSFYADPLMESLLVNKKNKVEKESGLSLLPTYSYWRFYTKYADLVVHKDRPSCEISITVNIASDGTDWPIYINDKPVSLKPGEAVLYLGQKVSHYRKEFEGDFQAQCFLHYVNSVGKNKEWALDKRYDHFIMKEA
tara:strand:- start:637 stop:1194 length:558 start_codon:yes stop_codon:yes gene_type:complete